MIKKSANNLNQMVHKYFYHTYTQTASEGGSELVDNGFISTIIGGYKKNRIVIFFGMISVFS